MAVEEFHVVINAQSYGQGGAPCPLKNTTTKGVGSGGTGVTEYSKEEMEKNYGTKELFTEKVIVYGGIQDAQVVSGEWASAAVAAKWCRVVLGAEILGVVPPKKTRLTNAEEGEKPMVTVKTTEFEANAAL